MFALIGFGVAGYTADTVIAVAAVQPEVVLFAVAGGAVFRGVGFGLVEFDFKCRREIGQTLASSTL